MRWWPRCIASERISRAVLESKCISYVSGPFRILDGPVALSVLWNLDGLRLAATLNCDCDQFQTKARLQRLCTLPIDSATKKAHNSDYFSRYYAADIRA